MNRAKAAQIHLLRAMDCFHEGIVLLDLSSTTNCSWNMLYVNDAFREATGLPHLLAGAAPGSGSSAAEQAAGGAQLNDFWQLFGHVTAGTHGTYNVSVGDPAEAACCQMWRVHLLVVGQG